MLSREDNELLCRVGRGTPMGELMRQYWMPAALSSELPERDGVPLRVRLLGEDLIAFRVSSGAVGLVRNSCPHRGASLFYGRNEAEGLRCVYHGWKFDVDGRCVDMPNEPIESDFKSKASATAYPCVEIAGVIWAYMGPPATMPVLTTQEWMRVPIERSEVCRHLGDCNWLQLLEGGIDTSHSSFLHRTFAREGALTTQAYRARSTAPRLEVVLTDYGFTYAGLRSLAEESQIYARVYQFVLPFHQM